MFPTPGKRKHGHEEDPIPVPPHHPSGSIRLPVDQLYRLELIQEMAVTVCNQAATQFAMQEFSLKNQRLKPGFFRVLTRKAIKFKSSVDWMYACPCQQETYRLFSLLPNDISEKYEEFVSRHKECLHVTTLRPLVDRFDDENNIECTTVSGEHNYSKQDKEEDGDKTIKTHVWEFPLHSGHVLVEKDQLYGVVGTVAGKLACFVCHDPKCVHVEDISEILGANTENEGILSAIASSVGDDHKIPEATLDPVSSEPIPVHTPTHQQIQMGHHITTYVRTIRGKLTLKPRCHEHQPGCEDKTEEICVKDYDTSVYTRYQRIGAHVYKTECGSCKTSTSYDGQEHGLLNMGTFMIHHEILREYMGHFVRSGLTLHGMFDVWSSYFKDAGSSMDGMTYYKFRHAWYGYLHLLDVNPRDTFKCTECGTHPEVVICDGTSLGYKRLLSSFNEKESTSSTPKEGSKFSERIFINDKRTRDLLSKYAGSSGKSVPLSSEEWCDLKGRIEAYAPTLGATLTGLELGGHSRNSPQIYKRFFKALSTASPVCAIVKPAPEMEDVLSFILEGGDMTRDVKRMEILDKFAPLLFDLLKNFEILPVHLHPVIEELMRLAQVPFARPPQQDIPAAGQQESSFTFFPEWRQIRGRGCYTHDVQKDTKDGMCSKHYTRHPTLNPGIFNVCCAHGVSYGFQLMSNVESPNIPFTIMKTMFPTAPRTVIYDNACNLHNYCLNRDPVFFRNTWFLVDRFHWFNHSGCSEGYNVSRHPHLSHLNTQVAEQLHSQMRKLKAQLSFMNHKNFVRQLQLFLMWSNAVKLQKLP